MIDSESPGGRFVRENPVLVSAMRKACGRHRGCLHMSAQERAALDAFYARAGRSEHGAQRTKAKGARIRTAVLSAGLLVLVAACASPAVIVPGSGRSPTTATTPSDYGRPTEAQLSEQAREVAAMLLEGATDGDIETYLSRFRAAWVNCSLEWDWDLAPSAQAEQEGFALAVQRVEPTAAGHATRPIPQAARKAFGVPRELKLVGVILVAFCPKPFPTTERPK